MDLLKRGGVLRKKKKYTAYRSMSLRRVLQYKCTTVFSQHSSSLDLPPFFFLHLSQKTALLTGEKQKLLNTG